MSQGTILKVKEGKFVPVEVVDAGDYIDPETGWQYHLSGFLGFHSGPGYAMTGWPTFWERLIPTTLGENREEQNR